MCSCRRCGSYLGDGQFNQDKTDASCNIGSCSVPHQNATSRQNDANRANKIDTSDLSDVKLLLHAIKVATVAAPITAHSIFKTVYTEQVNVRCEVIYRKFYWVVCFRLSAA